MRHRVRGKDAKTKSIYLDRGIKICTEWNDFNVFEKWCINNGYIQGLQLDRRDNEGDYSPDNCRFVNNQINSQNGRKARLSPVDILKIRKDSRIHRLIAEDLNVSPQTIWAIKHGQNWTNV